MIVNCSFCNKEINKKPYHVRNAKNNFCNKNCQYSFANKKIKIECENCKIIIFKRLKEIEKSKHKKCFCSKSCSATWNNQQDYRTKENHPNWKDGSSSGRDIALKYKKLKKCERCNWNLEPKILQVHHKNRDRKNNNLDNLEILCPNCHQLDHYLNKDGPYTGM